MNPETVIENRACALCSDRLGVQSIKLNVKGVRGWPDRMFLIPGGKPLFIEFKRPGAEPVPLQRYRIGLLLLGGYKVEVHDDAESAFRAVAAALDAARLPEKGC